MATTLQFDIIARDLASRTFNKIGARSGVLSKSIAGFGAVAAGALKGAGLALGAFSVAAAKTGLQTAAALERAQISFTEFTGSAQTATKLITDLKKFTLKTPFDLPGLTQTATRLLGVGVTAKQLIPTIAGLGDTAAAFGLSGEQFNRVTLAISQSLAKGRFAAEEFNQVSEAGIPILKILSRALGKPVPELLKLSRQGDLLSKDIFPKLLAQMQKDYGGAMSKQISTLTGLWSNLMDAFRIGSATAIQPLIPLIKDGLAGATQLATDVFGKLGRAFTKVTPEISAFINGLRGGAAGGSGPIVEATDAGRKLRDVFERIGAAVSAARAPLADFVGNLGGLFGTAVDIIKNLATAFTNLAKPIADAAKPLGEDFINHIKDLGDKISDLGPGLGDLATQLGNFGAAILGDLKPAIDAAFTAADKLLGALKPTIEFIANHPDVFGPLAAGALAAAAAIKALAVAEAALTAAQVALNIAMDANPVVIAVAALGALVGVLVYLYKTNLTVRKSIDDLFGALVIGATGAARAFERLARIGVLAIKYLEKFVLGAITGILQGLADVAKAAGLDTLARNFQKAADHTKKFADDTDKSFDRAIGKLDQWDASLDKLQKTVILKANIRDLDEKLRRARKELADKNLTKERKAKLNADITRLLAQKARAQRSLNSLSGRTVKLHLDTGAFYAGLNQARTAFHGRFAAGTPNAPRGLALVGERGPELVAFGGGERVFSNRQTKNLANGVRNVALGLRSGGGGGGGAVFNVNINGPIGSQQELKNWLSGAIDDLRREGRLRFV